MKKMILASMFALLSSSAFAAFNGPEISVINSVKEAHNATDDSAVMLTGHIVQSLGNAWCDGRCVQGPGTYSPHHSDMRLLAIPTSWSRVADSNPDYDAL